MQALGWVASLLLLFYAGRTILATPCLGVADIQDFWRVMRPAGVEHLSPLEHPGYYVRCEFQTIDSDLRSAPSSSALLVWAAKGLRWAFSVEKGRMDLRQTGLLYLLLVIATVAIALALRANAVLVAALLWVFVDPGYLLFLNSFYADAAMVVALLGAVFWFERTGRSDRRCTEASAASYAMSAAAIVALALLGGGSKMQFAALPFVLALALIGLPGAFARKSFRRTGAVILTLALMGCLTVWNFFLGSGPRFPEHNNYHAVFGGILVVAAQPERVLSELGIPSEYSVLPRTDLWTAQVGLDHPVHASLRGLSRLSLARLYLSDSAAMAATLSEIARTLALVPSHPRGTHVREPGDRGPVKRTYAVPWQFSRISRAALSYWPPVICLILLAAAAWFVVRRRFTDSGFAASPILLLLLWIASQCAVAVLGEGFVNLHQHLLGARLGLDLLLVLLCADLVRVSVGYARNRARNSAATALQISGRV